jgi:hypothetical protein
MKKVLSQPSWGVNIIEDTETGQISFICVCGGAAMYLCKIVLNDEEVADLRHGQLDAEQLVRDICKDAPRLAGRILPSNAEDLP